MLELKNITSGYGRQTVIKNASVAFEKGELTCVIGVNGSGKSTLLKTAIGILHAKEGEITVDGVAISSMKRNEVARRIAYLSQGRDLPDMTVEQLVLHGRFPYLSYPRRYTERDREIARLAMERVGIEHLAECALGTLSGGMRQNAYIAMALAQDTDYILLDEPTTYLDVCNQLELMRTLRELADRGKGVVAVMHDLPLAFDHSDRIALMRDGSVAVTARPIELCDDGILRETFGVGIKYLDDEKRFFRID